jgi:hypothetical protein
MSRRLLPREIPESYAWFYPKLTSGRNQIMATATFKPSAELKSFNPVGGISWLIAFEPLAAAMVPQSRSNQGDVLGLGPEDKGFSKFMKC